MKVKYSLKDIFVYLTIILALGWSAVVGASFAWNTVRERKDTQEFAKKEARTILGKNHAFRLWATSHGGVYVPSDERTPPNPYLSHVPERDIVTKSGKALTLMNPAYMLRQLLGEYSGLFGRIERITGIKALNPKNKADEWEKKVIKSFEQGEEELFEFTDIAGEPYLRAMLPLIAEKPCLKCHGVQGYKEGDVRGGVSVSVPMTPYLVLYEKSIATLAITHGVIWLLGLVVVFITANRMKERILERENAEKKLNSYAVKLKQRNEELQSFAHMVSHDLSEPLLLIRGFGHRLQTRYGDSLSQHGCEYLSRIEGAAIRMQDLIERLLVYSHVSTVVKPFLAVNLAEEVRKVVDDLGMRIKQAGGQIEVGEFPVIEADPIQMRQLLQNLISNSLKYHSPGVPPVVKITSQLIDDEIVEGQLCRIIVQDKGIGFAEKDAERIFDIFQRLHARSKYEGTGVGLAICKKIVERHGGSIRAESTPGQGAKFIVTLPMKQHKENK